MPSSYIKDPQAVLDYRFDWTSWLATSETISTSSITVSTGLTKDSESNTTTTATVWVSGGTVGSTYTATNHITTNQGRADDRTITIKVTDR